LPLGKLPDLNELCTHLFLDEVVANYILGLIIISLLRWTPEGNRNGWYPESFTWTKKEPNVLFRYRVSSNSWGKVGRT